MKKKDSGVYRIVNAQNDKAYIGSAVNIQRRFSEHRTCLNRGIHHCGHLQAAWAKYGSEVFVFETLEMAEVDRLIEREQFHLDSYERGKLYNACLTAYSHLGTKRSKETIAKMRLSAKTRKRPGSLSDEHKANLSAAHKGRVKSPEERAKLSAARKGKKWSQDQHENYKSARKGVSTKKMSDGAKAKLSAARMGIKPDEEARAKMSAAKMGQTPTEETRSKMSAAKKGKRFSEETRAKLSENKKAYYADKRLAIEEEARG